MKKSALKIAVLLVLFVTVVALSTSCDILTDVLGGGEGCAHTKVTEGSCIEFPTCVSCGQTVGDLADHDYTEKVVEPTCLEDGYTELTCKVCNDSEKSDITPAIGHSFGAWIIISEPSGDEAGEMKRECSECDFSETETIAPHTHEFESVSAKPATCTEGGWNAYEYCTQCNYSTKVEIRATGHAWGEYTSLGNGNHRRVCANDPSHVLAEPCSGGPLPICKYCIEVRPGNSTYGYRALGEYSSGEYMQLLYRDLTETAEEFFFSNEDVPSEDGYYIIGEFDINDYSLSMAEANAVWKIFYVSSPAYYWLDASVVTRGDALLLAIADNYARASVRRECDAAIEKMADDCALLIKDGMTELEKVVEIVSFIVKGMEYAYESDGVTPVEDMWAHNITGLAVHDYGVCEAYAKSFAYLCALNNIECAMGSGFGGGEAHAWNYVKVGGEWYGADITWTDNSGDEVVFDKFGLSEGEIFADHQPHQSATPCVDFIYEAPALSKNNIELTALYKNGDYSGIYKSIDDAFAAMTDPEAEYEINIGYYSSFVGALTHTITSDTTPSVKKLTITGKNEFVGEGYLDNNSIVYLSSSLSLGSDVELRDINLVIYDGVGICPIKLGAHTLTLGGKSVYIDNRIEGDTSSLLIAATERGAYIYGGADVYKLEIESDKIVLGADSHFVYASTENLYRQNNADIVIDNYT